MTPILSCPAPESCRELPSAPTRFPEVLVTDQPRRTRPVPRDALPSRQERQQARTLAHEYRAHAEVWYQALRRWKVELPRVPVPRTSYAPFTSGWEPLSTLGEGGPDLPTALVTPVGQVGEAEVARLIGLMLASEVPDTRAVGGLLEKLRGEYRTPATLLREDGRWQPDTSRHAAYAVAVLTLAVQLGDRHAEAPLRYARAVQQRPALAVLVEAE